jgi:putative sigma-54 modulation protein
MKMQIQSIHFDADVKLLDFIQKKAEKLDTFYDRIINGEVYLRLVKKEAKNNKIVEIKLNVPGATLFSKEIADSFEAATDAAIESLKVQLKKFKEKSITTHTV